jgi:hypothetical protein
MKHTPDKDLQHFLGLACAQVRHQTKEVRSGTRNKTKICTTSRLRLLEELIKEQIPNENSGTTARPTR